TTAPSCHYEWQRHAIYLVALFSVLAGSVPFVIAIINPPFIWQPLLFVFWALGTISLTLVGIALRSAGSSGTPSALRCSHQFKHVGLQGGTRTNGVGAHARKMRLFAAAMLLISSRLA